VTGWPDLRLAGLAAGAWLAAVAALHSSPSGAAAVAASAAAAATLLTAAPALARRIRDFGWSAPRGGGAAKPAGAASNRSRHAAASAASMAAAVATSTGVVSISAVRIAQPACIAATLRPIVSIVRISSAVGLNSMISVPAATSGMWPGGA